MAAQVCMEYVTDGSCIHSACMAFADSIRYASDDMDSESDMEFPYCSEDCLCSRHF